MADVAALNTRFGIPEQVSFREQTDGFVVLELSNAHASAAIALQGAHLMHWTPRDAARVVWLSPAAKLAPGKSIRGGVPVCWPWFGPHASEAGFPAHGFARTTEWQVLSVEGLADGAIRLAFRLMPNDTTRAQWPHATTVEMHMVVGKALELDLVTRNDNNAAITVGEALHTYFEVGDVRRVAVHGLDGCRYLDKVDAFAHKQQVGAVTVGEEVDRIYLESSGDCTIDDPLLGRRIRIEKRGSASTVVWNPWIEKAAAMGDLGDEGYLHMLCVESANAADDVVTIGPGGSHHLWVRYSVELLD